MAKHYLRRCALIPLLLLLSLSVYAQEWHYNPPLTWGGGVLLKYALVQPSKLKASHKGNWLALGVRGGIRKGSWKLSGRAMGGPLLGTAGNVDAAIAFGSIMPVYVLTPSDIEVSLGMAAGGVCICQKKLQLNLNLTADTGLWSRS